MVRLTSRERILFRDDMLRLDGPPNRKELKSGQVKFGSDAVVDEGRRKFGCSQDTTDPIAENTHK